MQSITIKQSLRGCLCASRREIIINFKNGLNTLIKYIYIIRTQLLDVCLFVCVFVCLSGLY